MCLLSASGWNKRKQKAIKSRREEDEIHRLPLWASLPLPPAPFFLCWSFMSQVSLHCLNCRYWRVLCCASECEWEICNSACGFLSCTEQNASTAVTVQASQPEWKLLNPSGRAPAFETIMSRCGYGRHKTVCNDGDLLTNYLAVVHNLHLLIPSCRAHHHKPIDNIWQWCVMNHPFWHFYRHYCFSFMKAFYAASASLVFNASFPSSWWLLAIGKAPDFFAFYCLASVLPAWLVTEVP